MDSYFIDEEENFEGEKLDLGRYFRVLKRKWWLVLIITLLVTVPWVYYLKQQPPIYEATALIRFKSFATAPDTDLIRSRTTELTSRSFAERVVAQLGLSLRMSSGEGDQFLSRSMVFKEFSTTRQYVSGNYILRLFPDGKYSLSMELQDSDKETVIEKGLIQDITNGKATTNGFTFSLVADLQPPMEIPFKVMSFRSAVESFQSRVRVRWEDRSGSLMNLTLTDTDPVLAAEMTNQLAQVYIEESASVKKESEKGRRESVEDALELAQQKLKEAERNLQSFKEKYGVFLESDQQGQISELNNLERQQTRLEMTISALQDLLKKQEDEALVADGDADPTYSNLRIIMNTIASHAVFQDHPTMLVTRQKLRTKEDEWGRYAPQHPRAKQIMQEILAIHTEIESIAKQEILNLQNDLDETGRTIAQLRYKQSQMPAREVKRRDLERQFEVAQQRYTDLLNKSQEAEISENVESEYIDILDRALVPDAPTNRDKKKKAAVGGCFGLFLGVGVVLVTEFLNKSIKSVDDVRRHLKLPVLGTIPQIDFSDVYDFQDSEKIKHIDQQLVTHDYSPTPIGEAYRSLRTNLMFTKDHGKIRSMVITSNEPGDGKSFTAANLSITLAQLKSRTLLIDSDLRRGVLHNTFGVAKEPGFSNYLTDVVPLQTIIHDTQIPNLSMISCGSLIPNPSELLGSHQMQRFMDEVRRKFDIIVFDSPPLNAATDAVVLGTQVDATVVVIRAGKTNRDMAKTKLDLFDSVPANVLGVILNGTTADMAHPGYSYYHY